MLTVSINPNPPIPALPRFTDKTLIDIRYSLIQPFANAHIYWDTTLGELIYDVEEPILSEEEKIAIKKLEDAMIELINVNVVTEKTPDKLMQYIDKTAKFLISEMNLKIRDDSYEKIFYYLYRDFIGLNEIEPMLRDYFIEDIECNGANTPIYIVHRTYRNVRTTLRFKDLEKLGSFVEKLAQRTGKYVSYSEPLLDGTLPDGSIEYNEPVIYRKDGIVKTGKIGEVIDQFYRENETNKPMSIEGIEVAAFDNNFKISWKKADYVYRHKINEELYKLGLEFGRKITLTGSHSIFVLRSDGVKSEKTDGLREGDYVILPSKIPENNVLQEINIAKCLATSDFKEKLIIRNVPEHIYISKKNELKLYYASHYKVPDQTYYEHKNKKILPIEIYNLLSEEELRKCSVGTTSSHHVPAFLNVNQELMWFLGLYIAEGWLYDYNSYGVTFSLNQKEHDLIEKIRESAKSCFNLQIYVEKPQKNAVKVKVDGLILWLIMKEVLRVSEGAHKKRVPELVWNVSKELQQEFIKAWHAGDYSTTVSEQLASDISYLALFNEEIAAFYKSKPKKTYIRGREINSNGAYYSNFYARNAESPYPSMIPMEIFNPLNKTHMRLRNKRIERKRLVNILHEIRYQRFENLNQASKKFLLEWEKRGFVEEKKLTEDGKKLLEEIKIIEKLINADFCFAKIKKISRVNSTSEYVYDFSVKNDENFVAGVGGICCHNSRVNATYTQDITSRGPTFTIRKFTKVPWTPTQLIALNTLSPEILAYFWMLIQYKSNIFIAGGTASGKTTLLNAIAFFIPPEARVVSIEDSVTGDSKIVIRENKQIRNITIKEFVDKRIDAEVMTADKNGKIIWAKPSDYIKHKVNKDIYEVLTSTGRKVSITQDHSLFSLGRDNTLKEIKPTELKEGESFIAVPRVLPIEGEEINEVNLFNHLGQFTQEFLYGQPVAKIFEKYSYKDFAVPKEKYRWWKEHNIINIEDFIKVSYQFDYEDLKKLRIKSKNTTSIPMIFDITKEFLEFCGLWLGDGSYDNHNANSVILSNADDECRQIVDKISRYLGTSYSRMNDGGVSLRIHSTVFYKFMKNVLKFDGYSDTKQIPDFIFGLSNEQVKQFIRGYFSADGCVKKYEVSCASQSFDILQDLQTLLLRYGIIARINDFDRKDRCINMSISSSEHVNKFKEIGFLQDRKNIVLKSMNYRAHHTSSDVIPLGTEKMKELNNITLVNLQHRYMTGQQNIGRDYMQRIAPMGSEFNDLSHNDILWDKVKKITKVSSKEIEVFDLSIPNYEKFLCNNILVHNTRELNLPRENWIPAVARVSIGTGGVGEIDLFDLLKNSFRQNPNYVIVGEVRGKEAFVLFQGMASGHPSISTMHADSVDTLIKRLETPPIELSPTLINSLDCVAIMTHAISKNRETRRLREIVEIINVKEDGTAFVNTPFVWNASQDIFYFKKESKVFEKISVRYGIPMQKLQEEFLRRSKLLYTLYQKRVFGFDDVRKIITDYYRNPKEVLQQYGMQ